MLNKIKPTNYKSIEGIELELTQVNILIGANGSGKSHILKYMQGLVTYNIKTHKTTSFITYNPIVSNFGLHNVNQIDFPISPSGKGFFNFLRLLKNDNLLELKRNSKIVRYVNKLKILSDDFGSFLEIFNEYSETTATENDCGDGFLLILFYITLFISDDLPSVFGIENFGDNLDPELSRNVISLIIILAKRHDKQVIITTHNPAVLDGLNLDDDKQRLYRISLNMYGKTKAYRINTPQPLEGQERVRLSESYIRGYF